MARLIGRTVQEKAIAHPVDSRLLAIARHKVCGCAHATPFKCRRKVVKRQRPILVIVLRKIDRPACRAWGNTQAETWERR